MKTQPSSVVIRFAIISDAALLADLGRRTFFDAFVGICSDEDMKAYLDTNFSETNLTCELSDPRSIFLIAEREHIPAGYVKLRDGKIPAGVSGTKVIEIERLYVEQKFLGDGIGPALMQRVLDEARQRGYDTVFLGVWENNFRAQAFYRKWGFTRCGEHIFMMGNDAQTDWWMQRAL